MVGRGTKNRINAHTLATNLHFQFQSSSLLWLQSRIFWSLTSVFECCSVDDKISIDSWLWGTAHCLYTFTTEQAMWKAATICPAPASWPLILEVVSESRVTWATSVPILVFLGLSVPDLGPMYATDRQTDVRHASSLNVPYPRGGGIKSTSKSYAYSYHQ